MSELINKTADCDWCIDVGPSYCDICVLNRNDIPVSFVTKGPHGRLIDAEKLKTHARIIYTAHGKELYVPFEAIDAAPTIVLADEEVRE